MRLGGSRVRGGVLARVHLRDGKVDSRVDGENAGVRVGYDAGVSVGGNRVDTPRVDGEKEVEEVCI